MDNKQLFIETNKGRILKCSVEINGTFLKEERFLAMEQKFPKGELKGYANSEYFKNIKSLKGVKLLDLASKNEHINTEGIGEDEIIILVCSQI